MRLQIPKTRVFGVDFTSAPRAAKPITIAAGRVSDAAYQLQSIDGATDFTQFEAWLAQPGPWIAGIDAPFGLPREAVRDLGWPQSWDALIRHCEGLGRAAFRAALDRYRESRPAGNRYAHRVTDHPAGSHSPLKLVNPPVGLMFLECTPRLLAAGITVPGLHMGATDRIALEAYPGFAARQLASGSYKADDRAKQTPERRAARKAIVAKLQAGDAPWALRLETSRALARSLIDDASGDRLDAVLAAMQASWSLGRGKRNFGLPAAIDPIEGWIATVPLQH